MSANFLIILGEIKKNMEKNVEHLENDLQAKLKVCWDFIGEAGNLLKLYVENKVNSLLTFKSVIYAAYEFVNDECWHSDCKVDGGLMLLMHGFTKTELFEDIIFLLPKPLDLESIEGIEYTKRLNYLKDMRMFYDDSYTVLQEYNNQTGKSDKELSSYDPSIEGLKHKSKFSVLLRYYHCVNNLYSLDLLKIDPKKNYIKLFLALMERVKFLFDSGELNYLLSKKFFDTKKNLPIIDMAEKAFKN